MNIIIDDWDIFLVVFIAGIALGSFVQEFLKRKVKKANIELQKEVVELQAKLKKSREFKETPKSQSSLHLEQIKKIEALEEELALQKRRVLETKAIAQEANRVKSEFLANIRHEIRTPMNSIMVFADLLAQESLDERLHSYTKNIVTSGQKLLSLLDNIIELSSVENGIFEIEESAVDIRALVKEIVEKLEESATKKGLVLNVNFSKDLPDTLLIDKEKVEEILQNLLENAIRFTDKGFVKIELDILKKNPLKNSVDFYISVSDSGIGIERKYLEKIFEIFEKPESDDEKIRGAGLGLSINRKLARAMKGDIEVQSKPGVGSTFTLILHEVEVALANSNTQESQNSMIDFSLIKAKHNKILLIDSDEESKKTLQNAFANTQFNIFSFENSRDAVACLQKEQVDVIFIDIKILTEDEHAVSKILMKLSNASIVTITSQRLKNVEFIEGVRIAGHLMRPISLAELFKITLQAINYVARGERKKELNHDLKEALLQNSHIDREHFLEEEATIVNELYHHAYKTNDLKSIEKFAHTLLTTATKHHIKFFIDFANKLLQKIELFDIDAIHSMMKEYQQKRDLLKSL